jgi:hypothetical protein
MRPPTITVEPGQTMAAVVASLRHQPEPQTPPETDPVQLLAAAREEHDKFSMQHADPLHLCLSANMLGWFWDSMNAIGPAAEVPIAPRFVGPDVESLSQNLRVAEVQEAYRLVIGFCEQRTRDTIAPHEINGQTIEVRVDGKQPSSKIMSKSKSRSLADLVSDHAVKRELEKHDKLQTAIAAAVGPLRLTLTPAAWHRILAERWKVAMVLRQWNDDQRPRLPDVGDLPDRESAIKALESLLDWSTRMRDRLSQTPGDPPSDPPPVQTSATAKTPDDGDFEKLPRLRRQLVKYLQGRDDHKTSIRDAMLHFKKRNRKSFLSLVRLTNEDLTNYYPDFEIILLRKEQALHLIETPATKKATK